MTQGTQMCAVQLGWQPGAASVDAGRRCYSNASAVSIAFLLLGGGMGPRTYWVRAGQHRPVGRSGDRLVTLR